MYTTLNKIRDSNIGCAGWEKLLVNLGKTEADDEPLSIATILESNGLFDALWCLNTVKGYQREIRLFAVDCARSVQHLMKDKQSIYALNVADRHANGLATNEELATARGAASDAAWAAAAWSAATCDDACDAAWDAAWFAARAFNCGYAVETQSNLLAIMCAEIEQRGEWQ